MQILLKYHTARLDNVLKSNDLMRHPIYPDGNCFINSTLYYLKEEGCEVETADSLRSTIADHFMQSMNNYINYLSFANCATEQERIEYYKTCVEDLKLSGHWNNDLPDCMPLVIANIYSRTVRVFARRTQNPLYDVYPENTTGQEQKIHTPIQVAFFAIKGKEHYDGVKKHQHAEHSPQKTPNKQPSSAAAVTPRKRADYKSPPKKQLFRKRKSKEPGFS